MESRSMTKQVFGEAGFSIQGALGAIFVQSLLPSTGSPLLDATIAGVLPAVASLGYRVWHDWGTNEGAFGHGLLSLEAKKRWSIAGCEILGAGLGGALSYAVGGYHLSSYAASQLYIMSGVVGTYAGRLSYHVGRHLLRYSSESNLHPILEPNFTQKISQFLRHDLNGWLFTYAINYSLRSTSHAVLPLPIQVQALWATALLSRWMQYGTSDKPLEEHFEFFPKPADYLPIQTPGANASGLTKNPETHRGETRSESAKALIPAMKIDACITGACWGASYLINYGVGLLNESEKMVDYQNATIVGVAFAIETTMRASIYYSEPIMNAAISGAKTVGNGLAASATVVGNGLSTMARMGMSLFPYLRTEPRENQQLTVKSPGLNYGAVK